VTPASSACGRLDVVKRRAVVITDAQPSHDDQLRSRQVRYLTMMSVRAGCLILAAVLVATKPPLLGLWLVMCVAAMVLLPWLAVLIANDRPVKEQHRLRHREQRAATDAPNVLGAREAPVVIESEPDERPRG
jgi:sterol desaturase/sphingolipid hydroxylase (fatty acid hydroxylase superfamily)